MMALVMHHSLAVHPGDRIRTETIEAHRIAVGEAARLLHVSRQALSSLLNGRSDLSDHRHPFRDGVRHPRRHTDPHAGCLAYSPGARA